MHHFSPADIADMDNRYRGNFINSMQGFKPVSLIGTVSAQSQFNLSIFSNIVHLGADPALIAMVNRPREASPHTLGNIESTGLYTINHITPSMVAQAHQTSAKYDADVCEFLETGLTPVLRDGCAAPFVAESMVQYSMKLVEIVPITYNRTFMIIGSVQDVYLQNADCVSNDGFVDLAQMGSITSLGLDSYYSTMKLARYGYARPNEILGKL